jgi:nicotinic acid mononucleotide adenylyltransferase
LFADKVRVLKQYAPKPLIPDPQIPVMNNHNNNRWSFVIGTDTMVRMLNPKYYNHDYEQMLQAQRSMGVNFVVGGRLDQTNPNKDKFISGKDALPEGLPQDVQEMFILLEESDFRVDISSTELRAQQAAAAKKS